ncbi:c2h2 finger domain [Diplodia corticola]|uniref:C2h2 finger domain n=1 Tax=Diplodia corticola TaxID=236234 RepID=A0A1J9R314_9PEZI|nr:c2h2 finger domain [Diplodia corticola]OJD34618.1 c2h2 finger domain [Diplodia corticola]
MSEFDPQEDEGYDCDSYQQSPGVHYRQASLTSYSAYATPQNEIAPGQQQAYYGHPYPNVATDARSWSQEASTYQGEANQWSMHRAAYAQPGMTYPAAYSDFFEGTDEAVHGNPSGFQFPGAESSGGNYGPGAAEYHHPNTAGHSAHTNYRYPHASTMNYPQGAQGVYGGASHLDGTPALRVHQPADSGRGELVRSASTSGYSEGSAHALSTAGSSMLSPNYGHEAEYEEEASSEGSRSPDAQVPASPNTANDPERKWKCKQSECAERKGFKRHTDLVRHMSTVHHREDQGKFDCVQRTCPRKGENGFTRKDHLTEHLRNFHLRSIPKRRGRSGKSPE